MDYAFNNMEEHDKDQRLLELYLSLAERERSKEFIGTYEAAKIAGVHQRTILRWIEEGDISFIRIGKRKYFILKTHLISYLKNDS